MFRLLDDPGLLAVSVLDDLFGGSDFRGVGFFFGGIFWYFWAKKGNLFSFPEIGHLECLK